MSRVTDPKRRVLDAEYQLRRFDTINAGVTFRSKDAERRRLVVDLIDARQLLALAELDERATSGDVLGRPAELAPRDDAYGSIGLGATEILEQRRAWQQEGGKGTHKRLGVSESTLYRARHKLGLVPWPEEYRERSTG